MFERTQAKMILTGRNAGQFLQEAMGKQRAFAGGIYTKITCDESGTPRLYELFPAAAAADESGYTGECFIDFRGGKPVHNTEVFRGTGVRLLQEAMYYPVCMFDELGSFDMIVPEFMEALRQYIYTGPPCLMHLLSLSEGELMRRRLGLSLKYTAQLAKLQEELKKADGVLLLDTDKISERKRKRLLDIWQERYL